MKHYQTPPHLTIQQIRGTYQTFTANQTIGGSDVLIDLATASYKLARTLEGIELMGVYVLALIFEDLGRTQVGVPITVGEAAALFQRLDPPIRGLFAAIEKGSHYSIVDSLIALTGKLAKPNLWRGNILNVIRSSNTIACQIRKIHLRREVDEIKEA